MPCNMTLITTYLTSSLYGIRSAPDSQACFQAACFAVISTLERFWTMFAVLPGVILIMVFIDFSRCRSRPTMPIRSTMTALPAARSSRPRSSCCRVVR